MEDGREPLVITEYYQTAALDAFYLPGHPTVYDAGTSLGARPTAYDFWKDTNLSDPSIRGRNTVLHAKKAIQWSKGLKFDRIVGTGRSGCWLGRGYRGVRGPQGREGPPE